MRSSTQRNISISTIRYNQTTTATPEQFIAGLTDFGPGREKIFGKSADSYLKVHSQGPHEADVTEGSGGVWERLHYDWSDPNRVVLTVTDSNTWSGHSGYTYTFGRVLSKRRVWGAYGEPWPIRPDRAHTDEGDGPIPRRSQTQSMWQSPASGSRARSRS